jgi:hypothetical protein
MKKHIVRAALLSAVIVFAMLVAFAQGMKVNCGKDVRFRDIKTEKAVNYEVKQQPGLAQCYAPARWIEQTSGPDIHDQYTGIVTKFLATVNQ